MTLAKFEEADALRDRSGNVWDTRPLVGLLYDLLVRRVPAGDLEDLVRESLGHKGFEFTNGWVARYAQDLAGRLLPGDDIEQAWGEASRDLKRVPSCEGWREVDGVHVFLRFQLLRVADKLRVVAEGRCRRAGEAPVLHDLEVRIEIEKMEQELFACGDLRQFFGSYVIDQAYALAAAKWKSAQGAETEE